MGKTMARIKDGIVENLEWFDEFTRETDDLKNVNGKLVNPGDTYFDGKFYRNGKEILSHKERLRNMLTSYDNALNEIAATISAPLAVSDEPPTIEARKQAILLQIANLQTALEQGGLR